MTFLAQNMLWFAAGGLIPIIIHLLHRQRYQRVRWAAMEFLLRALRKTQRRIRLENLILLLIRIAVMVLLALAIARPILQSAVFAGSPLTHTFIVIDNSYSMGYQAGPTPLLKKAQDLARNQIIDAELHAFTQNDRISILTMSDYPQNITGSGTNNKQQAKEVVGSIGLSDYGTSVLQTMRLLTRLVEDPQSALHQKRIYLITDLQRVGWAPPGADARAELASALKALSSRRDTSVVIADVGEPNPRNAAAVALRMIDPVAVAGLPVGLAAELVNFCDEDLLNASVTLSVGVGAEKMEEKSTQVVAVRAGDRATVHFRHTFVEPGQARLKVELQSDRLNSARGVDNARFLALEVREAIRVLCVDGEAGEGARKDETYYLVRALSPNFGRIFRVAQKLDTFFDGEELDRGEADVLVLANVAGLRPEVVARVEAFVSRGGGLLIALGGAVDVPSFNEQLWKEGKGLLPARLKPVAAAETVQEFHVGAAESGHRIFEGFSELMMTAVRAAAFQRFIGTEGHDPRGLVAALDDPDGSPLLLEKRFGQGAQAGRVLLFTSSLDHDWADGFPGTNIYLILMHQLIKHLAARGADERNLLIGDTIVQHLPARQFGDFTLMLPDERQPEPSISELRPGDASFQVYFPSRPSAAPEEGGPAPGETARLPAVNDGLAQAGFYLLLRHGRPEGAPETIASFAANVPPRSTTPEALRDSESNLERLDADPDRPAPLPDYPDFKARLIGPGGPGLAAASLKTEQTGFWRQLLLAVLGLLAVESLLAMLFGRRKA